MKRVGLHIFILSVLIQHIYCAKILGVFPLPSISHQQGFLAVSKALSLRGHEVTIITTNPLKDKSLTNLTEIDISQMYDLVAVEPFSKVFSSKLYLTTAIAKGRTIFEYIADAILTTEDVADLIKSDRQFDLVIAEAHVVTLFAFAARFKAPLVVISSLGVLNDIHDFIGNPSHPILATEIISHHCGSADTPLFRNVYNLYYNIWSRVMYSWLFLPRMDIQVKKHFGASTPYLGDIATQASLVMTNTNPYVDTVRPNVPTMINLELLHIKETKPIPKDLKNFIDSSPNGTVYFSLGTNVFTYKLNKNILKNILKALGDLPYNVIMKFEQEALPGKPKNVMLRKWLPQQDILRYPGIKVFVTQGGIQSIEESIYSGVPMVCLPFGIDQLRNVDKITGLGMAVQLDYSTFNAVMLKESIMKVATNSSFKQNVLKYKTLLEDQPLKGVDKAVWWIEYVLRHNGTKHLRYPGADMPFYKYFMLDVILFVLVIFLLSLYVSVKLWSLLQYKILVIKFKGE